MKFLNNELFIIAEAGVNHNGDPKKAHELIEFASKAKANAIKFQTFDANKVCTQNAPKAEYQSSLTKNNTQVEMLKALELRKNTFKELSKHANDIGILFMSTAFDKDSLDFLIDELDMKIIKVPSGEIDNYDFLSYIGKKKLPTIISTGASTIPEIYAAYNLVTQFYDSLDSEKNFQTLSKKKIIPNKDTAVLHCVSEYPAPINEANIKCINTLINHLNCPIGYSDHCMGIAASLSAVGIGASIIEKHFTLDRNLPGPDHKASINCDELKEMISIIRDMENSFGSSDKNVQNSEIKNRIIIRRSIVAKENIKKGDLFSYSNITCKRPADGIEASHFFELIGVRSNRSYNVDEKIDREIL